MFEFYMLCRERKMIGLVTSVRLNEYKPSFGANMNMRQILDRMDDDDFEGFGRPKIEHGPAPRRDRIVAYKHAAGDGLYYKGCKKKLRYNSEHAVVAAKRKFEALRKIALDFYECPICKGWHLCKAGNKFKINIPM